VTTNSENEKVKAVIRLPGKLPSEWAISSLAEVAEIIMGQSPSSEYYNTEGNGLPFFQGKAEFGDLYPEAVKWCSAPGKIAQKDDVLISVRAPVGPTNLAPSECCIGRGLAAIRPQNDIPAKYILHYLRSIESDIDALGTGTTFKAISGKTLREIPVPIAPLDQQKRIVAEIEKQFSRLDEAVANLKRVKANLKRYKAAVLKAAVEGRLVEIEAELAGRSFEDGAQLLQRILETRRSQWKGKGKYKEPAVPDTTDLPELPEGWVWTSLDSLIVDGPQNGLYLPKSLYGSGHPILRIDDYQQDWIRPVMELQRVRAKPEDVATYSLRSGDIVINRVNSPSHLGKVAVWAIETEMPLFESNMMRAALSFGVVPLYVAIYLRSLGGRARLTKQAKWAVNQASINQQDVCGTQVPLPPLAEQHRIVAEVDRRLSLVREVETQVDANLKRADHLKKAILTKAFTGHLLITWAPIQLLELERKGVA